MRSDPYYDSLIITSIRLDNEIKFTNCDFTNIQLMGQNPFFHIEYSNLEYLFFHFSYFVLYFNFNI